MQQNHPDTSPLALLPTPGRWRRFACMLYEGILLFGVIFIASYLFDTLTQSRNGLALRHARQALVFVAIGIYFILCWRKKGQTLPMKTWDIRLVEPDGGSPSLGRLVFRYILMWPIPLLAAVSVQEAARASGHGSTDLLIVFAPFTLFIWSWFDRDGQFLHDRLAGTRLVSVRARDTAPV